MKENNSESKDEIMNRIDKLNEYISELTNNLTQATEIRNKYIHKLEELERINNDEEKVDISNIGVKHEVVMFCKANIYDIIDADKETDSVCGIPLNYPTKYVFNEEDKIYFHFCKATPDIESNMKNSDVVIVNHFQFGEPFIDEKRILATIANIVNKPKSISSNDFVES